MGTMNKQDKTHFFGQRRVKINIRIKKRKNKYFQASECVHVFMHEEQGYVYECLCPSVCVYVF